MLSILGGCAPGPGSGPGRLRRRPGTGPRHQHPPARTHRSNLPNRTKTSQTATSKGHTHVPPLRTYHQAPRVTRTDRHMPALRPIRAPPPRRTNHQTHALLRPRPHHLQKTDDRVQQLRIHLNGQSTPELPPPHPWPVEPSIGGSVRFRVLYRAAPSSTLAPASLQNVAAFNSVKNAPCHPIERPRVASARRFRRSGWPWFGRNRLSPDFPFSTHNHVPLRS